MSARDHKLLLQRLKKQVRMLQRKEEKSRHQLKTALKKIRKLSTSYKTQLASKIRIMKVKLGRVRANTYTKIAEDLQKQLLKSLAIKGKSLSTAISKVEKKQIVKLTKGIAKKGKPKKSSLLRQTSLKRSASIRKKSKKRK